MIVFIKPVKGIREIADRVEIKVINYSLNQPFQTLYFCLQSQFNRNIEEGNLIIPEPICAIWGADDSVIIDWALDTLGLEEKPVVEEIEEPIADVPTAEELIEEALIDNDLEGK